MNKLICEVMNLCYEITQKSRADCFMEYSGHVNVYSVRVFIDGWSVACAIEKYENAEIAVCKPVTVENLEKTKSELLFIAKLLGVEV